MKLYTPPASSLLVSLVLAILGVAGVIIYIPYVTDVSFWLLLGGYIVLLMGAVARGF